MHHITKFLFLVWYVNLWSKPTRKRIISANSDNHHAEIYVQKWKHEHLCRVSLFVHIICVPHCPIRWQKEVNGLLYIHTHSTVKEILEIENGCRRKLNASINILLSLTMCGHIKVSNSVWNHHAYVRRPSFLFRNAYYLFVSISRWRLSRPGKMQSRSSRRMGRPIILWTRHQAFVGSSTNDRHVWKYFSTDFFFRKCFQMTYPALIVCTFLHPREVLILVFLCVTLIDNKQSSESSCPYKKCKSLKLFKLSNAPFFQIVFNIQFWRLENRPGFESLKCPGYDLKKTWRFIMWAIYQTWIIMIIYHIFRVDESFWSLVINLIVSWSRPGYASLCTGPNGIAVMQRLKEDYCILQ